MPRPNRRDSGPPPKRERVNEAIRISPIQLIDDKGHNHGPTDTQRALDMARAADLDLVEVAPDVRPPVCKIMDYGKFRYQKSKKDNESKKNQSQVKVKEVRLSPKTETHDLEVKVARARRFLIAGDKVQFTVRFKGREIVHKDRGETLLKKVIEEISDIAAVEGNWNLQGKNMMLITAPDKKRVNIYLKELERRRAEGELVPSDEDLKPTDEDNDSDGPDDDVDDGDDASSDDGSSDENSSPDTEASEASTADDDASKAADASEAADEPEATEEKPAATKKSARKKAASKTASSSKTSSRKSARTKKSEKAS